MGFLLDTNILSTHLKNQRLTYSKFMQHFGQLYTSRIVLAELYAWTYQRSDSVTILEQIQSLMTDVTVVEFDDDCATTFGRLRASLSSAIVVGGIDLLIAATAIAHNHVLVSHDADFAHVHGLHLVDWLQ